MGWLGSLFESLSGGGAKNQMVRDLLKHRIAEDPGARMRGQVPELADSLTPAQLMSLPEATIVTCVETWAALSRQGIGEPEIVKRITLHRGSRFVGRDVASLIRDLVRSEHSNAVFFSRRTPRPVHPHGAHSIWRLSRRNAGFLSV